MLEAMQRWANDDLRSLNGQIEFVLRESLRRVGRLPLAPLPDAPDTQPAGGQPGDTEPADESMPVIPPDDSGG